MRELTATIDSAALRDLLGSPTPPHVLDVRTPGEFESVHIPDTHNVPLDLLREHCRDITAPVGQDVVLVCRSGRRASRAAETLRKAGGMHPTVLNGGIIAWEADGMPVNRGETFDAQEIIARLGHAPTSCPA